MRGILYQILFFAFLLPLSLFAQAPYVDTTCSLAIRICSGQTYSYPAWTGTHPSQTGPFYDCLAQHNDPAWFYFMAGNTGNVNIHMSSTPCKDIDFICWGPFESLDAGCNGGLTASKVLDCSYGSACVEDCYLASMVTGKYYILLITNFSLQACEVTFSQTSGTGVMECIPPPVVGNTGPVCVGQNVQLTCSTVNGGTYLWMGPNGFSSTQQNPVINNVTLANSGTYTVVVTVGNMILNAVNTNLIINPLPTPQIIVPSPVCYGSSISIGGPSYAGYTYAWTSVPAGFTSNSANPGVSPLVNTTYYLTVTSDQNCTSTGSTSITVNPAPNVFVLPNSTVCAGALVPLGGNPHPNYTYSWTSDPPGFVSNLANPIVSPIVTTTYTLVVTNQYSCSSTYTVIITIDPASVVTLLLPFQNLCKDGPAVLLTGGDPPGGTYAGQGVNNGIFYPSNLTPGDYTITYTHTNSEGCTGTGSQVIQVINKPEIAGTIRYMNISNSLIDSCMVHLYDTMNVCLDSSALLSGNYYFHCLENTTYKVKAFSQKAWGGGNATDALLVAKYAVGMISLSNIQKKVADVNNSGSINVVDAYLIVRRWAGMINSFNSGNWYITQNDSVMVNNLDVTVNLQALCYGDLDGSYLVNVNPAPPSLPSKPEKEDHSTKNSSYIDIIISTKPNFK